LASAAAGRDLHGPNGSGGGDLRTGAAAAAMGDTKARREGRGHTSTENSGEAREEGRCSAPPDEARVSVPQMWGTRREK